MNGQQNNEQIVAVPVSQILGTLDQGNMFGYVSDETEDIDAGGVGEAYLMVARSEVVDAGSDAHRMVAWSEVVDAGVTGETDWMVVWSEVVGVVVLARQIGRVRGRRSRKLVVLARQTG